MSLIDHLRLTGALLLFLAALHATFPGRFQWREELARLSLLNRQIFWVHTLFIVLVLVLNAALVIGCAESLLDPHPVSRACLIGLTAFWLARLLTQLFVYDRALWRGNGPRTAAHVLFTGLWCYLATVYGTALATVVLVG